MTGEPAEAQAFLAEASKITPNNPAILRLYSDLHESRLDWAALEKTALAWCSVQPLEPAAWRSLAQAQWETGRLQAAMESFRMSLKLGARTAGNLAKFGRLCLSALDLEAAIAALDEAESLDPDDPDMLSTRANPADEPGSS